MRPIIDIDGPDCVPWIPFAEKKAVQLQAQCQKAGLPAMCRFYPLTDSVTAFIQVSRNPKIQGLIKIQAKGGGSFVLAGIVEERAGEGQVLRNSEYMQTGKHLLLDTPARVLVEASQAPQTYVTLGRTTGQTSIVDAKGTHFTGDPLVVYDNATAAIGAAEAIDPTPVFADTTAGKAVAYFVGSTTLNTRPDTGPVETWYTFNPFSGLKVRVQPLRRGSAQLRELDPFALVQAHFEPLASRLVSSGNRSIFVGGGSAKSTTVALSSDASGDRWRAALLPEGLLIVAVRQVSELGVEAVRKMYAQALLVGYDGVVKASITRMMSSALSVCARGAETGAYFWQDGTTGVVSIQADQDYPVGVAVTVQKDQAHLCLVVSDPTGARRLEVTSQAGVTSVVALNRGARKTRVVMAPQVADTLISADTVPILPSAGRGLLPPTAVQSLGLGKKTARVVRVDAQTSGAMSTRWYDYLAVTTAGAVKRLSFTQRMNAFHTFAGDEAQYCAAVEFNDAGDQYRWAVFDASTGDELYAQPWAALTDALVATALRLNPLQCRKQWVEQLSFTLPALRTGSVVKTTSATGAVTYSLAFGKTQTPAVSAPTGEDRDGNDIVDGSTVTFSDYILEGS
jgi:hypothetical protein